MADATQGNEHAKRREIERKSLAGVGDFRSLVDLEARTAQVFTQRFFAADEFVSNRERNPITSAFSRFRGPDFQVICCIIVRRH